MNHNDKFLFHLGEVTSVDLINFPVISMGADDTYASVPLTISYNKDETEGLECSSTSRNNETQSGRCLG